VNVIIRRIATGIAALGLALPALAAEVQTTAPQAAATTPSKPVAARKQGKHTHRRVAQGEKKADEKKAEPKKAGEKGEKKEQAPGTKAEPKPAAPAPATPSK
jgi:hypothetical protein